MFMIFANIWCASEILLRNNSVCINSAVLEVDTSNHINFLLVWHIFEDVSKELFTNTLAL